MKTSGWGWLLKGAGGVPGAGCMCGGSPCAGAEAGLGDSPGPAQPWPSPAQRLLLGALLAVDAQLLCWQALPRGRAEPAAACEGNLRGTRSHCIHALARLNRTRGGPHLESCDCAQDRQCVGAKRAVEPCLPRRHPSEAAGVGCTEARQRRASLSAHLAHCGQLFNGRKCSSGCRASIRQLLATPSGVLLDGCVGEGVERPFCEALKENMSRLCSRGEQLAPPEQPEVDEDEDGDGDYHPNGDTEEVDTHLSSASQVSSGHVMVLLGALVWML